MDIEAVAKVILVFSIGLCGLHLLLVFRQVLRQTSNLRIDSSKSERFRFPGA